MSFSNNAASAIFWVRHHEYFLKLSSEVCLLIKNRKKTKWGGNLRRSKSFLTEDHEGTMATPLECYIHKLRPICCLFTWLSLRNYWRAHYWASYKPPVFPITFHNFTFKIFWKFLSSISLKIYGRWLDRMGRPIHQKQANNLGKDGRHPWTFDFRPLDTTLH